MGTWSPYIPPQCRRILDHLLHALEIHNEEPASEGYRRYWVSVIRKEQDVSLIAFMKRRERWLILKPGR